MNARPLLPWRGGLLLAAAVAVAVPIAAIWLGDDDGDPSLLVLAPSSLAPIEDDLDAALSAAGIGPIEWVFAGSQSIVAQVADGVPADVVLVADTVAHDAVIAADDRYDRGVAFATNHLVLAVAPDNPGRVDDVSALADPAALIGVCAPEVPCGRLAAAATDALGVGVRPDTEETSARALTTKLSTGELDAGLVYRTDAQAANLATIPVEGLDRFTNTYWGTANDRGTAVLDLLTTDAIAAVLDAAGFAT
ncbi:MAG: substrate-binding domain-containing protein [Actinomycetota bacterium]